MSHGPEWRRLVLLLLLSASSCTAYRSVEPQSVSLLQTGVQVVQPITTAEPLTAAEVVGISLNQAGDRQAFISGLLLYSFLAISIILIFSCLRQALPLVYQDRQLKGEVPTEIPLGEGFLSWIPASLAVKVETASRVATLDSALLLEFLELFGQLMLLTGLFQCFVMAPQYLFFAGGAEASKGDRLSEIGMGNIRYRDSYLWYLVGFVEMGITLFVIDAVFRAQKKFMRLRFDWLRTLPEPRASTMLVSGIPKEHRSEAKLLEFFEAATGTGSVVSVAVVKKIEKLQKLIAQREAVRQKLLYTEAKWMAAGRNPEERPKQSSSMTNREQVDTIDFCTSELERLSQEVLVERANVEEKAKLCGGVNTDTAFVTFRRKKDAELARTLIYSNDGAEWIVEVPPDPQDVRWEDFTESEGLGFLNRALGYLCLLLLFVVFTPAVVFITNVANAISFEVEILNSVWQSLAPTMGLTIFMMLQPTMMRMIFMHFFKLKAETWSQQLLQSWTFAFQVVFVILVTSMEGNIFLTVKAVAAAPFSIFGLLASNMPQATHFYMNYLVLQWVTDTMPLLRLIPLIKFRTYRVVYGDDEAKHMSEPEDQDFYGMGARSAKFSAHLAVGIIFGTLSPTMAIWAAIDLFIGRLVLGWLVVFAESKKPDLGGPFWVAQLHHVFVALTIYNILMVGVLFAGCATFVPGAFGIISLCIVIVCWVRFAEAFRWELLPFKEVTSDDPEEAWVGNTYVQPELKEQLVAH